MSEQNFKFEVTTTSIIYARTQGEALSIIEDRINAKGIADANAAMVIESSIRLLRK